MATGFKKREVSAARAAVVEAVAASAPIVGNARMGASDPNLGSSQGASKPSVQNLGSSQDRSGAYQVGMVYDVPLSLIKSNPVNPRAVYTSAAVDAMAMSLSTSGQRIAATGFLDDDGRIALIEGETRLRGARAAGLSTLRIEVRPRPAGERELYEEARAANVERRDQTPLDDALKWRELLDRKVYPSQAALAKALSIGEDQVSRTLSLANLPQRVILAAAEPPDLMNLKMLNALREYWEVQGDDAVIDLIAEAAKSGLGYRDVVARRKFAAKGPVRRPRAVREPIAFRGAKGEIKTFEEDGRVELSIKGLDYDAAADLVAKLIALFSKEA